MEYKFILAALEMFKTMDWESFFIFYRITFTCQNDADCCIVLKLQIDLVKGAIHACLKYIHNIIFHTWENYLCLRITESGIVFQHLRSLWCQHQSKENHSFELSALSRHSIHSLLIDIFFTKFVHFIRIERARRKCSHTTGIETLITVQCAFVILRGGHDTDGLAVYKAEHGHLASGHELFDDHLIAGRTKLLVLHDLLDACLCFL